MVNKLGARIKRIRSKRGLSQSQLADLCAVHKNTIFNIEKTGAAKYANVVAIAKGLRISVGKLTESRSRRT